MLIFWIIAAGLMLVALALVIPPFFRKTSSEHEVEQNSVNIAIYQEKLSELQQDELTSEQFSQAKQELEKNLLQDIGESQKSQDFLPAKQKNYRWASIVVIIGIPLLTVVWYQKHGKPELIVESVAESSPHSNIEGLPKNFDQLVNNLANRLKKQPNDIEGWHMLARSYTVLKQYQDAIAAYEQGLKVGGDKNADILVDFAKFLASLNSEGKETESFAGKPASLLDMALKAMPDHQEALWYAGYNAAEQKDYLKAVEYWQKLFTLIPPGEEEGRNTLKQHIDKAREFASQQGLILPAPVEEVATPTTTSQGIEKIEVTVNVAPALQEKVKADDTLLVYAQALSGPKMPLAIVTRSAKELPLTVRLDNSTAMMPNMKLSGFSEVTVTARISHDKSASPKAGDLFGQMMIKQNQSTDINIVIDQTVE